MPTYDYQCEANGKVVEVRHGMNEVLGTWAELCDRAGLEPGDTPGSAPVRRLISGGYFISSSTLGDAPAPACSTGMCGSPGVCGLE